MAVGHQRVHVFLQRIDIELFQFFAVIKSLAHRIGLAIMLVQNVEVQRIWPPIGNSCAKRGLRAMHHGAFANVISIHGGSLLLGCLMQAPSSGCGSW